MHIAPHPLNSRHAHRTRHHRIGTFRLVGLGCLDRVFDADSGGSSKSRVLKNLVDGLTGRFGVETTALALVAVGVLLAMVFLALHRRDG